MPNTDRPIAEVEAEIVEEFAFMTDWEDKYEHLLEHGKQLKPLPEALKIEENRIHGCQSKVWLISDFRDGMLRFTADSDSVLTKSLVALLLRVLSGRKPEEILAAQLSFIDKVELREHLSPNRRNGLGAMIKQMKIYALAYTA